MKFKLKVLLEVNAVLIIGILGAWLTKGFGPSNDIYIILIVLLIPLNLYLIYSK